MAKKEKKSFQISSFSILFIILIVLGIITMFLDGQGFAPQVVNDATVDHVVGAQFSDIIMAPFRGFQEAIEISIFILVLGGFLNIVTQTGALEAGIQSVVKKLKGNEIKIIPILMILFSIGGTAYGMAEETIPFYALLSITMVAAGFDTVVAAGTVLLGSGAGVLGSTINPFATGVAMDALNGVGIAPNTGLILGIGFVIWVVTTAFAIFTVMSYAKKVKQDKGSTILSLQEQEDMKKNFVDGKDTDMEFTGKHKAVLTVFGFGFLIMITSLIPWGDFGITIFDGWTSFLTGNSFGEWYFADLAMWFFIVSIIVAVIAGYSEQETIDHFIDGTKDMISVVLIIVVARGVSVLMTQTHLDLLILDKAAGILSGLSPVLFVIGAYILYLGLSFLIPSTSGLAVVSMPVMGGLAQQLGLSADVMTMIFVAACGLVNLITPTSGVVMGGLNIAKVNYPTWLKFMRKPLIIIAVLNLIILIAAMLMVS